MATNNVYISFFSILFLIFLYHYTIITPLKIFLISVYDAFVLSIKSIKSINFNTYSQPFILNLTTNISRISVKEMKQFQFYGNGNLSFDFHEIDKTHDLERIAR